MQKCANKTMPNIRKENIDDMMLRCQDLQSFKSLCGKDTKAVNVQADRCYNNALYSGVGKTAFQPSTQAIYVVAENETNKKQIINVQTKSKLCSKRKHGSGIECQHSGECFANIDMASNIGNEEEWAKHSFSELASAGLEVEYLTTDPDSSSYRATMRLYADGVTSVEPKHLLDTRHVSHNHRKYIKNMSELTIQMPAKFKYEKQKMQDNFSMDLAERCKAEFTQAFNKLPNDTLKFKAALSYTCDAIVNCYHGHHDICHIYSFVCMKKCNTTWLQRSPFLTKDFTIKSCDESLNLVCKCAEYRLGPAILERTKMNTNTQKVEATNRSMRRSLPSTLPFREISLAELTVRRTT